MARSIDTAEVAKMIRVELKKAHAGVKFSVRTDRYAGGSSISVGWTDGPTRDQVEKVTAPFAGARFDGMIDLKSYVDSWWCKEHGASVAHAYGHSYDNGTVNPRCCAEAEAVSFGGDYVFARRTLSAEFTAELAAELTKIWGYVYDQRDYDHCRDFTALERETAR